MPLNVADSNFIVVSEHGSTREQRVGAEAGSELRWNCLERSRSKLDVEKRPGSWNGRSCSRTNLHVHTFAYVMYAGADDHSLSDR